ncbi:phosphoserine transaminase [Lysinibacter sp. HNR]|uniref:phosphoserine transaminase n=1 Tax=Lysinibacter sp. HNR TaxID=3031408 RepID=UPI002434AF45|nr:phosphoserine transaminase [Lysinibacter sp. HNR]WGD36984.1 phosphoserine transaminase [Lysinibacter sp. HNR]
MSHNVLPPHLIPSDGRFGCGPSKVRPEQVAAVHAIEKTILGTSHRQSPVKNLVGQVREGLADLFQIPDGYEVVLANGGSTAFWDAAAHSLIEQRSQNLVFGEFGSKFAAAAATPFLNAPDVRKADAGSLVSPEAVPGIDLYAWPHNETSTGVMAPVHRVQGDTGALTVVDATSAAGGVNFDTSQADVYYFAPQKNFASDGGLWFALLSPAAIERIERIASSNRYIPEFLSLGNVVSNSRLNQTLNTPAITTLAMLNNQVQWILDNGGLEWASARTAESSGILYDWVEHTATATPFVSNHAHRSQVVVTIDFAESVDATALAKQLRANGIVDTEPYRKLGRNQLRIATFVAIEPDDVRTLTGAIDYLLERL